MQHVKKVPYGVLCAISNIRLGIARSYYMEWAMAYGYKKSTASHYWATARKLAPLDVKYI